jgi:hypothetical protein
VSLDSVTPEKKPSLASLKPDKLSGVAARKRAVKKIEAAMTTKVTTTKVKKVTDEKGEEKVVVKRASKKMKTVLPSPPERDSVLVLPTNISIRAREKALVILDAVTKDFEKSARQVAYISGLCFILLGASMSLAFTTPFSNISVVHNGAQTVGSVINTQATFSTSSGSVTGTVNTLVNPTFQLINGIPDVLTRKELVKIDTTHAKDVDAALMPLVSGKSPINLDVNRESGSNTRFWFELDPASIDPGKYRVKIIITSDLDDSKHPFYLNETEVPLPPQDTTASSAGDGSTGSSATTGDTATDTSTTDTGATDAATAETTEVAATEPMAAEVEIPRLNIKLPNNELKGKLAVKIEQSATVPEVRLTLRLLTNIKPILDAKAGFYNGAWYYYLNTENFPNGEYELVAHSRFNDAPLKSGAVRVRIANFIPTTEVPAQSTIEPVKTTTTQTTVEEREIVEPEAEETEATSAETTPLRTFSEFSIEDVSDFSSSTKKEQGPEVNVGTVFDDHKDELRELLKRYAIAQQSGDPIMLELASKELEAAKKTLIGTVLANPDTRHLADNIDEELGDRFETLKKRVETFEELRKTASNNESASDKDNDGISDYDERFLFGTDPEQADSDSDGVIDGVEVMGGYNPADPAAEAVIDYELPQDAVAVVDNDLLKVDGVAPVVRHDLNTDDPDVHAEIRGKGLPNSFVTLYIFSTPTIVTVRTDRDGAFVYNFEKELEDGEHEVYVAITDNTGSIVAHSNPFKFVKEAQAFSPVDAEEGATSEIAPYTVQSIDIYNVIVGLGILALGLILLMLGVNLRERDKANNPVPSNDLKVT